MNCRIPWPILCVEQMRNSKDGEHPEKEPVEAHAVRVSLGLLGSASSEDASPESREGREDEKTRQPNTIAALTLNSSDKCKDTADSRQH
jgi:hypothetical protein